MIIDTSPLGSLRSIKDQDIEIMLSWRNAPSVRENMYTRHEISLAEHQSWWQKVKESLHHRYFMYECSGVPLGVIGFTDIDPENNNSSWAFYASPDAPRGTGSRMEALALEYAFSVLKLHKLKCEVLAFNKPVIKLHNKFGFMVEGIFREQHKTDKEYVDIYCLGLLKVEWECKRNDMLVKLLNMAIR